MTLSAGFWRTTRAEEVVVGFMAIVQHVDDYYCGCVPDSAVSAGDTLLGYYHYDSDTPDAAPSPNEGAYVHTTSPYGIVMYIGDYVFTSDKVNPDFRILLDDSVNPGGTNPIDDDDHYDVYSLNNMGDPFQPGLNLNLLHLWLSDTTGQALTSDSLSAEPPVMSNWPDSKRVRVWGADWEYEILAEIVAIDLGPPTGVTPYSRQQFSVTNYPNPFNPTTTILYHTSVTSEIKLRIYDVRGQLIRLLVDESVGPGEHTIVWDGTDAHGKYAGSGVYFLHLKTGQNVLTRKMILLK
jgi:hypothetical protein